MEQNQKLTFHRLSSHLLKHGDDVTVESLPALVEKLIRRKPTAEELKDAKWKLAAFRAQRTATWAKTMTKQLISRSNGKQPRWHVVNFIGPGKAEPRGIVDLLAIRKNHHNPEGPKGDPFEIVLLQVKGGGAGRPSKEDRKRLRKVRKQYDATAVLLSEWKKGAKPTLSRLNGDAWVKLKNPADVFCPAKKKTAESNAAGMTPAASTLKSNAAKKAWATRKAAAANG